MLFREPERKKKSTDSSKHFYDPSSRVREVLADAVILYKFIEVFFFIMPIIFPFSLL